MAGAAAALLSLSAWGSSAIAAPRFSSDFAACPSWRMVPAPALAFGVIGHVDGTSRSDVWAVGAYQYAPAAPIALHWNGSVWTQAPEQPMQGYASGMTALSASDAWAVGSTGSSSFSMHWDGSIWGQVPVPVVGSYDNLASVTALSSTDVWAGGSTTDAQGIHPLVMHWGGSSWTQVPAPDGTPNSVNVFYGLTALGPGDIWAVGYHEPPALGHQPLIEHWDGTTWTVVDSPSLVGDFNLLHEVSGTSSGDIWAVGTLGDETTAAPLIEHWDGTAWAVVQAPRVPGRAATLFGVAAISTTDVWAVGERQPNGSDIVPLVLHWDGARWGIVRTPTPDQGAAGTVAAITPSDVWAGGSYYDPNLGSLRPLILRSKGCGLAWPVLHQTAASFHISGGHMA